MKPGWIFPLIALILVTLACNWSDVAPPAAPEIEPSPLPTFAIPSATPAPTATPLPSPTSTPDAPLAWPKDLGVNCRYGPGQEWEAISSLSAGTSAEIQGRTINTAWWYINDPLNPGGFCWVAYDVVDTAGNLNIIPIVEPPTAAVTHVTADVAVTFTGCGSANQVAFNGSITVNGPATVRYQWEVAGDTQETLPADPLVFTQAGTQKLPTTAFSADCGDYNLTLRVSEPNGTSTGKAFKIQAP